MYLLRTDTMAHDILEEPTARDAFSVGGCSTEEVEQKWPLRRTALFVVTSNLLLWGATVVAIWRWV